MSPASGAWEIWGPYRDKWAALGWEQGFLRYPTSSVITNRSPIYGSHVEFQGGAVYWSADTGAHEEHGAILWNAATGAVTVIYS